MSKLLTFSVVLFLISLQSARSLAQEVSWTADCDVVAQATKRLPDFNFSEAKVPGFDLLEKLTFSKVNMPFLDCILKFP